MFKKFVTYLFFIIFSLSVLGQAVGHYAKFVTKEKIELSDDTDEDAKKEEKTDDKISYTKDNIIAKLPTQLVRKCKKDYLLTHTFVIGANYSRIVYSPPDLS